MAQQTRSFRRENERKCGTPRTWHYELVVQSMQICKSKRPPPCYLRLLKTFRIWKVFFIGLPRESTVASMLCWHRLKSFQVMILSFNLLKRLIVNIESLSTTKKYIFYCVLGIASIKGDPHDAPRANKEKVYKCVWKEPVPCTFQVTIVSEPICTIRTICLFSDQRTLNPPSHKI